MSLLSGLSRAAREFTAQVLTDGINILGTATNPIYVTGALPLLPTVWDTFIPPSGITTGSNVEQLVAEFDLPIDGVIAVTTNVVATTVDGSLWATWTLAGTAGSAVFTRISGVVSLQTPTGPQGPLFSSANDAANWKIRFDTDGTRLQIFVTGELNTNVKWSVHAAGNYTGIP